MTIKTHITNINQWGNSYGIRIPKHIIDTNFSSVMHFKIQFDAKNHEIILTPIANKAISKDQIRKSLNSMKPVRVKDVFLPKPVGKEVW